MMMMMKRTRWLRVSERFDMKALVAHLPDAALRALMAKQKSVMEIEMTRLRSELSEMERLGRGIGSTLWTSC